MRKSVGRSKSGTTNARVDAVRRSPAGTTADAGVDAVGRRPAGTAASTGYVK